MNAWGTSSPLTKSPDGSLTAVVALGAGEHQLKIGAEDWAVADYGLVGTAVIDEPVADLPLILRGGNIRISVAAPGTFAFQIVPHRQGPILSIKRLGSR